MATTTPTTKKKKKNPIVLTAPVPNVGGGAVDDLDSYVHANSLQSHFTAKERVDGFLVAGKLYTLGLSAVSMYPNVEAQTDVTSSRPLVLGVRPVLIPPLVYQKPSVFGKSDQFMFLERLDQSHHPNQYEAWAIVYMFLGPDGKIYKLNANQVLNFFW